MKTDPTSVSKWGQQAIILCGPDVLIIVVNK